MRASRTERIARLLAAICFLVAAHAAAQPVAERPWRVLILLDALRFPVTLYERELAARRAKKYAGLL